MPAAAKAPHAPCLHASVNALGARNNFPCVDSLRMQGDMHMDRRERQRRCSGQPTPLNDKVLAAENSRNPLSQMRRNRERTQHPLVSYHARKDSHPHTNAAVTTSITRRGTIPARRLISAATHTVRMRTTAVQRRPNLRAAVCIKHCSYNVPL